MKYSQFTVVEPVMETDPALSQLHYLLHHAVIRIDKTTTKLCIVYDALAKLKRPSLNDYLHTGSKFNKLILNILMRFHLFKVTLTVDIEEAFLMIPWPSMTEMCCSFSGSMTLLRIHLMSAY